jgi:DNA-binding NtrC family response regulator
MRKLLVLSSKPLGNEVSRTLEQASWELHETTSDRQARQLLGQQRFLVGLCVFWEDDDDDRRRRLGEMISDHPDIRWIAALPRDAVQHETCAALIATRVHDYFSLPLDPTRLAVILGHAYGMTEVGITFLNRQQESATGRYGLLGRSEPMQRLFGDIEWATKSDAPVLIIGETGSGKERTALAIHANSPRRRGPFVPISCGTTAPKVLEHALFGRTEGTRTRTSRPRASARDAASGGTLFLDDIAEMPLAAQARLLRFLTAKERAERGAGISPALDVRVIAASPTDLDEHVESGRILSDLFYRLAVVIIRVPPLRERTDDMEMLAQHFLMEAAKKTQAKVIGISRSALAVMKQYDWPGNLLELSNRIFRAVLFSRRPHLSVRDLDLPKFATETQPLSLEQSRDRAEKETLRRALARNRRNVTRAAKELQISRMTLYRLLEKHGMDRRN